MPYGIRFEVWAMRRLSLRGANTPEAIHKLKTQTQTSLRFFVLIPYESIGRLVLFNYNKSSKARSFLILYSFAHSEYSGVPFNVKHFS